MVDVNKGPVFTGLIVYRNPQYGYSLLYPEGWHHGELAVEGGHGVIFAPHTDDTLTSLTVEARDLGTTVTGEDLPWLQQGFLAGLRRFRNGKIEGQEEYVVGDLIGMEARLTFREDGGGALLAGRRWVRLLYQGSKQVCLIAQGATVEQFDYWLPMFNQMMRTFRFGDWWANATGREWLPSLDAMTVDDDDHDAFRGPTQ